MMSSGSYKQIQHNKIARKVLILVSSIFIILAPLLWFFIDLIIVQSFSVVEERFTYDNIRRVEQSFLDKENSLDFILKDWAQWDDTYRFANNVGDSRKRYRVETLNDESLFGIEVNIILIVDNDNKLLYGKTIDFEARKIDGVSSDLVPFLNSNQHNFLNHRSTKRLGEIRHQGLIAYNDELYFMASRPILRSNMRGPIAGTLFFARKLDFNYIEKMSKLLKYPLKFREMNQNEIANLLEKKQKYSIEKRSKTWMDAYFYYYDIFAESAIEIKIAIRRDINLQAIRSRKIIAVITIFLIFSFCLILYLLFRRLVIREVELRQQKLKVLQTKAIEDKNEELAESNQRATRLNRVLTHDLLTPVQTALLYIETLLGMDFITKDDHQMQYDEQNEIQETLKLVVDQASMQKDIMQHALELDAIESGKREIDLAPVSISKAVQDALKITRPKAEKKGVEIIVIEESNNYFVLADERSLILSVLNNIIGNAIKFSSSGQVIEIEITEINETIVIIDIRDQGIGIPVEMIEHLFVGDKKTSRVGTDGEFGTGFGLPLANSYVCQYGGEIVVESLTEEERDEMSYTTTFSIRLSKTRPNI